MQTPAVITDIKCSHDYCKKKKTARQNATLPDMGLLQRASFTNKWRYSSHVAYFVAFLQFSQEGMKETEKAVIGRS
jgi:hypothetical protein